MIMQILNVINPLSNNKNKKFANIDELDLVLLQQYIPMYDEKTKQLTDFESIIQEC